MKKSQLEGLAILSEECGEVQQIIGKILRYGLASHNPLAELQTTNRELLERELGDLSFAIGFLADKGDIDIAKVNEYALIKKNKIQAYLKYNVVNNNAAELV
ncbi:MAG: hypothetical protein KTR24_10810 [Saprospiraceae bacterium]|nr:hypothetical protein [Saprospiraceae bacterium]